MPAPVSLTKPCSQQAAASTNATTSNKFYTHILCKSILLLLLLIAIPLFPSQPPHFFTHPLLTKLWELLHLLFIGVAVCYGFFSRRNVEVDFEPQSLLDDSQSSYVSRIFHVPPIFEDGYENPYASHDKNLYQTWNSQYYGAESIVAATDGSSNINEKNKIGSLHSENNFRISLEHDDSSTIQAWNSQYFQGESQAVLSQENYELYDNGKPGELIGHKSLGLPVRSLKSRIRDSASVQLSNGNDSGSSLRGSYSSSETSMSPINWDEKLNGSDSGSSLRGSCSSSDRSVNEKNFGDMDPINLEEKFNESVAFSQVPWRSSSVRMEIRDNNVGFAVSQPSHFRPLSVDETQFESLKTQSVRSTTSYSSQASSMSYSAHMLSPSHSISSDVQISKAEGLEEEKCYRASYPPASPSLSTTLNGEVRLNAFHLRRYSSGSLFQKDFQRRLKMESKDLDGNRKECSLGGRERRDSSLKLDKMPTTLTKPSSKGKSVRTIRSNGYIPEALKVRGITKISVDNDAGKTGEGSKSLPGAKSEMKNRGLNNLSHRSNEKNADSQCQTPKLTSAKYQKEERDRHSEKVTMETEEDLENEIDSFRVRPHENAAADAHDPSEVDKKAGEFIAKFREQIRLQKVASMEKSRRGRTARNQFT